MMQKDKIMKATRFATLTPKRFNLPFYATRNSERTKPGQPPSSCGDATKASNGTGVMFTLDRPGAKIVYLCGDFNDWSPRSLRMFRRGGKGLWERSVSLEPGRYEYKFIVDGEWIHDPAALENRANHCGSFNSIIHVGVNLQDYHHDHASRPSPRRQRND
jgi:1,4-alpha-glucan branching enzyme